MAGTTEAVLVVTPMEVVKIRLQSQYHSLADPLDVPRYVKLPDQVSTWNRVCADQSYSYRNAAHAAYTVIKEEGVATLWRGVSLTALRQATNQAGRAATA